MKTWDKTKRTLIYVLHEKNKPEEIKYVGKTCSSLQQRLYHHISKAKNARKLNLKENRWVINWLNSINYEVEIVEIDSSEDWTTGEELEKFYIKKYKELGYNLCNLTIGGDGGTPKYKGDNNNSKAVLQYDLEGNFIKLFNSRAEAEEFTKVKQGQISGCINMDRIKSAGGFIWKNYSKNYPLKISSYNENNQHLLAWQKTNNCKISQFTLKGDYINTYRSIHYAAIITKINVGNIRKASQKKIKSAGGFIWKKV